MNKNFAELNVGDRFTFNNKEFVKVQELRISCCKVINAQAIDNGEQTYIANNIMVTVNA